MWLICIKKIFLFFLFFFSISAFSTQLVKKPSIAYQEVKRQLNHIFNLCQKKSFSEKIKQLNNSLLTLRNIILKELRNPDLSISDGIYFRKIYYSLVNPGIFTDEENITVALAKKHRLDFAAIFLHNYEVRYNLNTLHKLNQFPHTWAKKIYQSLKCIQYTKLKKA